MADSLKEMLATEAIKAKNDERRLDLEERKARHEHPEWYTDA